MKDIFLLTTEYPFGLKETYLDNEIENCKCIKNIFIVPLFNKSKNKRIMDNDEANITVVELENTVLNKFMRKIGLFISDKYIIHEILDILKSKKNIFKKIKKMIWFWNRSIDKYIQIEYYIKKNKYDIDMKNLVVYSYWMAEHAYIGAKLKLKFKDLKFISRCHGYDLYEYRNKISYIPFRNEIFENIDYIIPISNDGYKYLTKTYKNIDERKIHLSLLGTKDYGYNLKFKNDKLKIVSCSNLVDVKRVDLIIEALKYIKNCDVEWIHYGDGPNKGELIEKARNLPKNINYKFLGQVSNKDIMMGYENYKFDLFLNVSESEGLPVSIMEAQSKGIVVIATDVGGTYEIIDNGINGFLINKNFDVKDLSELIVRYMELPYEHKIKMKQESRRVWNDKFNSSDNYKNFYEWIDTI